MESAFDTTGIITKIYDNFSVVTVTVNDVTRSFFFSKYLLYVFGLQCEGHMANILDEGMEVGVRYRLFNKNVRCIAAVWISEKPDHLCKPTALKPLYEQKGTVIEASADNVLVRIDGADHTVLISKEVVFLKGHRIPGLDEGEAVAFDAIPFESEHPTGASYQATCAWVGSTPILIERFGLSILNLDDPWDVQDSMEVMHGFVTVIPNEVMAFAEIKCVQHNSKILLFRSSFAVDCVNIKDHINIGDSLCMCIRYEYLFDGSKQFYAAQAWKDGCESDFNEIPLLDENPIVGALDNVSVTTKAMAAASESVSSVCNQSDGDIVGLSSRKRRTRNRKRKKIEDQSALVSSDGMVSDRDENNSEYINKGGFLFNDPPLSGVISILSLHEARILYNGFMIHVNRDILFKDCESVTDDREYVMLVAPGGRVVNFEAVECSSEAGFSHEATCVWVGKKPPLKMKKRGSSPGHQVETNLHRLSQAVPQRVAIKNEEAGDVLIGDPPLSGPITLTSENTATITYKGYKIFVRCVNMYVDGKACSEKEFVLAVTTAFSDVNFEAIKLSAERYKVLVAKRWTGFTHEATCAWIGNQPTVSSAVPSTSLSPKEMKFAQTDNKSKEVKFTAQSPVLYREDPPLEGVLKHDLSASREKYTSFDSVCISFGGLKVFLDCKLMYYMGKLCPNETALYLISRDIPLVNFEAVKSTNQRKLFYGFSHEATCVWIGQRPGLMSIIWTIAPFRFNLLEDEYRTYRGVVHRFCLPKVALVYESQHDTAVILHVRAFGQKHKRHLDIESGEDCINAFVQLNDVVEFRVSRVAAFRWGLSATDAKIVSTDKKTSEAVLVTPYPVKYSLSTGTGALLEVTNSTEMKKLNRVDGFSNPYSEFETYSTRKEVPFKAQLKNEVKKETSGLDLQCDCEEMMAKFDPFAQLESISIRENNFAMFTDEVANSKTSSDEEKSADNGAKAEAGSVSVQSPLSEMSQGIYGPYPRPESSPLRQEVPFQGKLTHQEILARGLSNAEAKAETGSGLVRSRLAENPSDPYPQFEGHSMQKDIPVEGRITCEQANEGISHQSSFPKVKAVFDGFTSDSKDTKADTRSIAVQSPVTQRPSPSCEAMATGEDALSEVNRNSGNLREVSAPRQLTRELASTELISSTPPSDLEAQTGSRRNEAKVDIGATGGHSHQSPKLPTRKINCSVM